MADIPARMLRDANLSDDLRAFITTAGGAFTQEQIDRLNRSGVRFWGSEGIPPEFTRRYRLGREAALHPLKRAHYLPQIKVIRLLQSAVPTHIIHEIAHAWDHVRNRTPQPSGQMRRMFNSYLPRVRGNNMLPFYSLYQGYSTRSAWEFYAEGYTVFHHPTHPNEQQQLRLLRYAPELYDFLSREVSGLPTPNRSYLERLRIQ